MAGLSPFQFSSRMQQTNSTSGILGGITIGGNVGSMLGSAFTWYTMWINPEKVDIAYRYIQKKQHTTAGIVTYHYRQETPVMSVSGKCGWIAIQSQSEQMNLGQKLSGAFGYKMKSINSKWGQTKEYLQAFGNDFREKYPSIRTMGVKSPVRIDKLHSDNTDNSPRLFLSRLKGIADEPMYFVDSQGIEHYNIKYIKIFTKQYPEGVVCEGYYTSFNVPEAADDVQTIEYNFEFIIENFSKLSELDKELGMFGSTGQGALMSNVARMIS